MASLEMPNIRPNSVIKGKKILIVRPRKREVKGRVRPRRMFRTRPMEDQNRSTTRRMSTNARKVGARGWIFFRPMEGMIQSKRMIRLKRIEVPRIRPMNILFLGSAAESERSAGCGPFRALSGWECLSSGIDRRGVINTCEVFLVTAKKLSGIHGLGVRGV